MKITTLAWVLGGALAVSGIGVGLVACSSDSGSGTTNPGVDSGTHADTGTTGNPDTGTTGNPDTGTTGMDAGTGADCGKAPTLHPPKPDAGGNIFCPFSNVNDAGNQYCTGPTQHCCEPSMGTGSCQPIGTACGATDTDWQCESPSDCAPGNVCCGKGNMPSYDNACMYYFGSKFTGTTCAATCPAGTFTVCETNHDCPLPDGGTGTCTPMKAKGNQFGFCQ